MSSDPLYDVARQITDSVFPPIELEAGKRYLHPEYGLIEITGGCYRDPVYGRISNFWDWTVVATGEHGCGYGADWPEPTE